MIQDPIEESRIFFEKAKARRDSISQEKKTLLPSINGDERNDKFTTVGGYPLSLSIDIGREEGTWTDPRWAAKVNRPEWDSCLN